MKIVYAELVGWCYVFGLCTQGGKNGGISFHLGNKVLKFSIQIVFYKVGFSRFCHAKWKWISKIKNLWAIFTFLWRVLSISLFDDFEKKKKKTFSKKKKGETKIKLE